MNAKRNNIRAVITDIDGVLTDGKVMLGDGTEIGKRISFKDLDAVFLLRGKGIKFGIISGESDAFTDLLYEKMHPDFFFTGCKDKRRKLEEISEKEGIALSDICYIGDGKYDLEAVKAAGIGVCPMDAVKEVKNAADIVLDRDGGRGCLADIFSLLFGAEERFDDTDQDIVLSDLLEHKKIIESIINNCDLRSTVCAVAEEIGHSLKTGGQILLCGNGGSAADAQHIATEFVSRFYHERKALNAEALTVNTSTLTAVGNDYSYERVFARQVEAKGRSGDVLIGISTSGESKNIIEAFKSAKQISIKTIAFTGNQHSTMEKLADIAITIPAKDTPRIQEMHIMIGHIICEIVERKFIGGIV